MYNFQTVSNILYRISLDDVRCDYWAGLGSWQLCVNNLDGYALIVYWVGPSSIS